jgi:hypothetical protein
MKSEVKGTAMSERLGNAALHVDSASTLHVSFIYRKYEMFLTKVLSLCTALIGVRRAFICNTAKLHLSVLTPNDL